MQFVSMMKTFDGALHADVAAAKRHLDKVYGDKLTAMARKMANQKFTTMAELIDAELDAMAELKRIKMDYVITTGDDLLFESEEL